MTLVASPLADCKPLVSMERLRDALTYSPETGDFRWRAGWSRFHPKERAAGCLTKQGYIQLAIDGREYKAHRIAWFYVYGVWPKGEIDHIDHDRANNRIVNLRDVTTSINQQNQVRAQNRSKSGLLGITCRGKYGFEAKISLNGHGKYLGKFPTAQEAHEAYLAAKRAIHPGNTL